MSLNTAAQAICVSAKPLGKGLWFRKDEKGPVSWYFVVTLLIVLVYGLVVMFSASYPTGYYYYNGDSYHFIRPQLMFALVGLAAMAGISRLNYRWLKKITWILYVVTLVLLVIALIQPTESKFHRWITFAGASFQPSELAKFSLILSTALFAQRHHDGGSFLRDGLFYPLFAAAPALVLIEMEPHRSCLMLILCILFTMLFCSNGLLRMLPVIFLAAVAAYLYITTQGGYVQGRLENWTLFSSDTSTMGWQTQQGVYSIASGGLLGLGIGNGRQKHLWLPEANNDFIFAVLCEELGFLGAVVCIVLFAALILQGIMIALRAPDLYGTLLGIGIISQIAWQVAFNIAVVTNTMPNTGISLPFFSSGGTSLLTLLAEMGVVLSISRAGNARVLARQQAEEEQLRLRREQERTRRGGQTVYRHRV